MKELLDKVKFYLKMQQHATLDATIAIASNWEIARRSSLLGSAVMSHFMLPSSLMDCSLHEKSICTCIVSNMTEALWEVLMVKPSTCSTSQIPGDNCLIRCN